MELSSLTRAAAERIEEALQKRTTVNLLQVVFMPSKCQHLYTIVADVDNCIFAGRGVSVGLAVDDLLDRYSRGPVVGRHDHNIHSYDEYINRPR